MAPSTLREITLLKCSFGIRHAWMSYMVDKPPSEEPILQLGHRQWEKKEHRPTMTASRARYTPYST